MVEKSLEERIREMIVERLMLKITPAEIGDDDDLRRKFGLDSPRILELVIGCEEHFGIQLGDDEFSVKRFNTVRGIADIIRGKITVS